MYWCHGVLVYSCSTTVPITNVLVYHCTSVLVYYSSIHYRYFNNSLRQASLSRATKQLMPIMMPRGRRHPLLRGGGSGLSYHVFRGAMTGRCLASGGVRLRRQGTGREGWGGGGGRRRRREEKRREEKRLSVRASDTTSSAQTTKVCRNLNPVFVS